MELTGMFKGAKVRKSEEPKSTQSPMLGFVSNLAATFATGDSIRFEEEKEEEKDQKQECSDSFSVQDQESDWSEDLNKSEILPPWKDFRYLNNM